MKLLQANDRPGAYPDSYYAATAPLSAPRMALSGKREADVCIIGAGYTGLSAALHLAQAGRSVVVLEAHRAGWGASGRNGGQLATGQRKDQIILEKQLGQEAAHALWDLSVDATTLVKSLIAQLKIDCALTPGIAYLTRRSSDCDAYRKEAEHMAEYYDYPHLRYLDKAATQTEVNSPAYVAGILDHGAAHLHPLRYALGLAHAAENAGALLYEKSQVQNIDRENITVHTRDGCVRAGHILLATNGYLDGLVPEISARVMPINNFIVATEPLPDKGRDLIPNNIAVADDKFVVNYFRLSEDGRLLFGGGENYSYRFPKDIKSFVQKPLRKIFPQMAKTPLEYGWGGTLGITESRLPHLAWITPRILSAAGYSGQGVALATHSGKLMADAVMGKTEGFETMARLKTLPFPGGSILRWPILAAAMSYYALLDRL